MKRSELNRLLIVGMAFLLTFFVRGTRFLANGFPDNVSQYQFKLNYPVPIGFVKASDGSGFRFFGKGVHGSVQGNRIIIEALKPQYNNSSKSRSVRITFGDATGSADLQPKPDPASAFKISFLTGNKESVEQITAYSGLIWDLAGSNSTPERKVYLYVRDDALEFDVEAGIGFRPEDFSIAIHGGEITESTPHDVSVAAGDLCIRLHNMRVFQPAQPSVKVLAAEFDVAKGASADELLIKFKISDLDMTRPVLIDPVVSFVSAFGGADDDRAYAVATDQAGNFYLAGQTSSADFTGPVTTNRSFGGGTDAFVSSFSPDGKIRFVTFIGGSGDDRANGITVDSTGYIIISGVTGSTNFPVANPFQGEYGGGERDGFITKLSPDGASIAFSTYLGGSGVDDITSVASDYFGYIYVAGDSQSPDFPTVNALQPECTANFDGVVAKFDLNGKPVYSTWLGGNGLYECAVSVAADLLGRAFLTGYTISKDFPIRNASQITLAGGYDAFVTVISPLGNELLFSTYIGGSADDFGRSIAVGTDGSIVVCGDTYSTNFPTVAPIQSKNNGRRDIFVVRFPKIGATPSFSTYLGGSKDDLAALCLDGANNVFLVGVTGSTNFPVKSPFQPAFGGGVWDSFVTGIASAGNHIIFSSLLGGSGTDQASAACVNSLGQLIIAGATASTNFPGAVSRNVKTGWQALAVVISDVAVPLPQMKPIVHRLAPQELAEAEQPTEKSSEPEQTEKTDQQVNQKPSVESEKPEAVEQPEKSEATPETKKEPDQKAALPQSEQIKSTNQTSSVLSNEVPEQRETGIEKKEETKTQAADAVKTKPEDKTIPTDKETVEKVESATEPTPPATQSSEKLETESVEPQASNQGATQGAMTNVFGVNLIFNGGAEVISSGDTNSLLAKPLGWEVQGTAGSMHYGAPGGFPSSKTRGPADRGERFFAGGTSSESKLSQEIDLSQVSVLMDERKVFFTLSGYFGGMSGQNDYCKCHIIFKDTKGEKLAEAGVEPVTLKDRGYITTLLYRSVTGKVPAGTRKAEVQLVFIKSDGSFNDAYADCISLILSTNVSANARE